LTFPPRWKTDTKAIDWKWDDGPQDQAGAPDAGANWFVYDPAGNLTETKLAYGTADE
jgi:hypothetical protein